MGVEAKAAEILQGTLELLILCALATGEKHGYEVAAWIHTASADALELKRVPSPPRCTG
jgi:DNA-binding PadR family transcriptional regulator